MFDLDIDKGIGDARKKLREQRDVTEQEKIRIQAMKNQDNSAQEFKNCQAQSTDYKFDYDPSSLFPQFLTPNP